tara:strand:+ start:305 stop:535 length:231 start_codon:yes stop_codon:yes gene_type:complete
MFLKEWIKKNNYTYKSFADLIKVSERNVEKWSRGERMPRCMDAEKIFIHTNNQVTGHDLYEQQIQRQKANIQREKV